MATAEELAQRFEAANTAVIALVEGCDQQKWQALTPPENWTVAATAMHIANSHQRIASRIGAVANQGPQPPQPGAAEARDARNAAEAAQFAAASKAEVLAALKTHGAAAAATVRGLDASQFGSVAGMIESPLISHVTAHAASIQAAGQAVPPIQRV